MNTFDVRHRTGDLLIHLENERFNPELRQLLNDVVPSLPHGEIARDHIEFLREHSSKYPKVFLPDHVFGPICLEVLQPSTPLDQQAWGILVALTGALASPQR